MNVIECRVSGGVTGTRISELKDLRGRVRTFETREEAQAVCNELNRERNNEYARASFHYWPEER